MVATLPSLPQGRYLCGADPDASLLSLAEPLTAHV